MCGIMGFYNIQRPVLSETEMIKLLDGMQQRIAHRGPDSSGIWTSPDLQLGLASRRLSIIDLSEAGNQPMHHKQHNIVLCFNGEIYNYQAMRRELEQCGYQFFSTSDTEVIINAYHAWGISFLERLEGMFAIALFDLRTNVGYLIRDRIGVKPLYFSLQGGMLSFASEIKAFWPLPWISQKINQYAAYHYLTFMVAPAPWTMFDGIYKLPAGFYAEIDVHKRISFHEWYSPLKAISAAEQRDYDSEDFCIQRITHLLTESVKKRMVADVPVGAYLSGGLDSSLNVALMSQYSSRIKTFTIACAGDEHDERAAARRIATQFNTDHHETVISEQEAFDFYERMLYALDEPLADCVCIPFYYVSALARANGMKVVQVGEGADELFFGYPSYGYYASFYRRLYKPFSFVPARARQFVASASQPLFAARPLRADFISNWAQGRCPFWGGAIAFSEQQKQTIFPAGNVPHYDPIIDQMYPGLRQDFDSYAIIQYHLQRLHEVDPQADIGKQMLYIELKQRLPELLLMRADKMSMAVGIEAREPYLDHMLIEFMLNVPLRYRFKNNQTKYLLKKVAENFLPNDVIYRPKVGFAAPTFRWFAHGKCFPAYFQELACGAMHSNVVGGVDASANASQLHRAVQNWVLQQMWAFSRGMYEARR